MGFDARASLTIIGGGHSGHCLYPNVVSVDMSAFDQVHILTAEDGRESGSDSAPLVIAEAGCKTGDIVRKTMAAGVTVPLGARPSVGAGLWLQGGIGHLGCMGSRATPSSVPFWLASTLASSFIPAVYQANTDLPVPCAQTTKAICYGR